MREKLLNDFTVEQAIMIMKTLKCKVYGKDIVVSDLTKKHKKILELLSIIVPINLRGI